jgi:hypothetical protein
MYLSTVRFYLQASIHLHFECYFIDQSDDITKLKYNWNNMGIFRCFSKKQNEKNVWTGQVILIVNFFNRVDVLKVNKGYCE